MPILAFGAIGGLILLFAPIQLVLGIFLFLTFVVVGPLVSIARIAQGSWVPYIFALALLFRVPMEWYHTSKTSDNFGPHRNKKFSPVMVAVGWYFVLVLISLLANLPSPQQFLVGAKMYLFIWGVFLLLAVSSISPKLLEQVWKGVIVVAILQLPFALYQRLFEVGRREANGVGFMSLDAIVGTFPGGEGGGASGSLAMFCVFAMALAIALRRNKALGAGVTVLVVLASLLSIGLGEVKVIIVLFPLALLVMNYREVIRRPLHFLAIGAAGLVILAGILTFYGAQWESGQKGARGGYLENAFGYVLDPDAVKADGHVGRAAALNLWYRDGRSTPQTFLLGYGPGASQNSSTAKGVVASRYAPLQVNSTTAAGMLWDIGILGLVAFFAISIIAFFEALRLSSVGQIPAFHRSTLEACALMMALTGVAIPYDKSLLGVPQFQVLFLLALFQIVYWHSRSESPYYSENCKKLA